MLKLSFAKGVAGAVRPTAAATTSNVGLRYMYVVCSHCDVNSKIVKKHSDGVDPLGVATPGPPFGTGEVSS